jgi:hypothetical protein
VSAAPVNSGDIVPLMSIPFDGTPMDADGEPLVSAEQEEEARPKRVDEEREKRRYKEKVSHSMSFCIQIYGSLSNLY